MRSRGYRRSAAPGAAAPAGPAGLWAELAFTGIAYWAYSLNRNAVPAHREAALHRAQAIWDTERFLHLNIELAVNHAADKATWLIVAMNYYYATLHFIVTIGVLVWLYVSHRAHYRSARTALYAATLLALAGFTFCELAPPRFLAGKGFVHSRRRPRTRHRMKSATVQNPAWPLPWHPPP